MISEHERLEACLKDLHAQRRPWTAADDANLRKFHAEGKTDETIGYIIGRNKTSVWARRRLLGLETHERKNLGGFSFARTPEHRARVAERNRKQWQNPEYRQRMREMLIAARIRFQETKIFRLPKDRETRLYYRKLKKALGLDKAREELAKQQID